MERQTDLVLPSRDDPVVAAGSEAIGGPAGRRLLPGTGWWTPARVIVLLTVLVFSLGIAQRDYCRDIGWPRENNLQYVHVCYSDMPHLYRERGFAEGNVPYLDTGEYPRLEYPVLIGAVMTVTAKAARATERTLTGQAVRFYDLNAWLMLLCAAVTALAVVNLAGRRPWDAALYALAPGLALTGTINWDMMAVAFAMLGLLAWARRRPLLAGALLGLGTAAKLYPVLLLGPLFLVCLRAPDKRAAFSALAKTVTGAAVAWLAVNVPVLLLAPNGWRAFWVFNEQRGAEFGSIWLVLEQAGQGKIPHFNLLVGGVLAALFAGIAWLALTAPARPRLAQLAFLTVAAFAVFNKVYSPQYVLWLIPLAALARPRWRDFIAWQACEVVYYLAVWYYLAGSYDPNRGLPVGLYSVAIMIHVAGTLYFAGMVIRDLLHPQHDPVRPGPDALGQDPLSGPLVAASRTGQTGGAPAVG
ncbi:Multimodular transpeptidase-transglycosylase [Carbonactinospora thermoautotrophica]|uniref:Multimodular transpeptidase-transglycosylase n=1 Tax=Carbonactinospora thermoautotrophica TaxID=1469144 RepID=A0A132MKL4_9ACTN|nr:glycosyltransferase 87 family protein [Carbonactinospora thermoautotrophica]KWW98412.1 Multimodular transpeptidase-transglycosylase [Carbonactinospora thermoautotrophica]